MSKSEDIAVLIGKARELMDKICLDYFIPNRGIPNAYRINIHSVLQVFLNLSFPLMPLPLLNSDLIPEDD